MNQGQKANKAGDEAELLIASTLLRHGCHIERQVNIGPGIYGTPIFVDFVVRGLSQYPDGLIVESKWQTVSGSVDEKYPYLVRNIEDRYPLPTIIVLSGDGYKLGAEQWLKQQTGGNLVAVKSLTEFIKWLLDLMAAGQIIKQTLW